MKILFKSFLAGMFVAIGGVVLISLSIKNLSVLGAFLFSIALISIIMLELYLFTGKIGYVVEDHTRKNIKNLIIGLCGNLIGAFLFGIFLAEALPNVKEYAVTMCQNKLEINSFRVLILSFMCGILMYTAVEIYKRKESVIGVLFCIPVFIISGFEHSIADMFYFSAAGVFTIESIVFIILVIIGNTLGGVFIPLIQKIK